MTARVIHADCLDAMRAMPDASIDAIVTDPPYGLSFMGRDWDHGVPGPAFWTEALRVAKPGAHLVAFGGTRTYHRLACAIEDAGWEIRDCLSWLYGSGFPKSLDVSKAIDKAAGAERSIVIGTRGLARWSEGAAAGVAIKDDGGLRQDFDKVNTLLAPATAAARQWQGWGTALKPAWEPIILARKPLGTPRTNVVAVVESALRRQGVVGEILWKPDDAKAAGKSRSTRTLSSTEQQRTAVTSAANAVERGTQSTEPLTATSTENGGISGPPRTQADPENSVAQANESYATTCSTPTEARVPAVGSENETSSPSTISTAEVQRTGELHTEKSMGLSEEQDSLPTIESFAGIATGLTGSTAHVHIKRDSDGFFVWPAGLPKSAAGRPSTVAANVLAHGTGAINVDECRIGTDSTRRVSNAGTNGEGWGMGTHASLNGSDLGRWPANVALDEEAAAMLDEQSGIARPKTGRVGQRGGKGFGMFDDEKSASAIGTWPADSGGGASRFFYTAKASRSERNDGCAAIDARPQDPTRDVDAPGGNNPRNRGAAPRVNSHPTVKPVALMRWLVRMVTPPDGVVLDPFCGSGTTLVAAIEEGFDCIGIEREAEYVAIIEARVAAAQQRPQRVAKPKTRRAPRPTAVATTAPPAPIASARMPGQLALTWEVA